MLLKASLGLALLLSAPDVGKSPSVHDVLQAEHERPEVPDVFKAALASADAELQRVALRALGRQEKKEFAPLVRPFTEATEEALRREAIAALAQMGDDFDYRARLGVERAPSVRAAILEALGRRRPGTLESEQALVAGLTESALDCRRAAARGLEWLIRFGGKSRTAAPETLAALRQTVVREKDSPLRASALSALNLAGAGDDAVFAAALQDPDPQVRRLGVIGGRRFLDDASPIVRLEALKAAPTCERAVQATRDASGHVVLAGIDALGALKCPADRALELATRGVSWRERARAAVALARVAPEQARPIVRALAKSEPWQARVYAAQAARVLEDRETLALLSEDPAPNVAAAAITTPEEALRALRRDHSGLLVAAATKLKEVPDRARFAGAIVEALVRISKRGRVTVRDERLRLLEVLKGVRDATVLEPLRPLLEDRDPEVAKSVASLLSDAGTAASPRTLRYRPEPFPSARTLEALRGATALVRIRGVGELPLSLLVDEAPATAATFAQLADAHAYDGLTFHRIVPNFVLQGGSPGADEYDALTDQFMRDEVGATSNERGTFGVSTRGRDTGDGQIYVNLVDNGRLDHTYTVFARLTGGLDVMDRILEGDVIESITIRRQRR